MRYPNSLNNLILSGILLIFASTLLFGDSTASLTSDECESLYEHQLRIISSDDTFPLSIAIRKSMDSLASGDGRDSQIRQCLTDVDRTQFLCRMKARSTLELLNCKKGEAVANTAENQSQQTNKVNGSVQKLPGDVSVGTVVSRPLEATPDRCKQAYEHMLGVYEKHPSLQDEDNRKKLMDYWRSKEARDSFQRRCLTVFQPRDLGCILSTKDPDIIQGCLIQIPSP